jgi:tetratricopeptide (TPR) repeat protein
VTIEQEIEAALRLSTERKFDAALALYREMLARAGDDFVRMRVLFGMVDCSTWLGLEAIREETIRALKQFPDYDVSRAFIVMTQARAFIDFGRTQEALDLVNENLGSAVLHRDDFRDWKYEHLFLKGQCLVRLKAFDEALCAFDAAHSMDSEGPFETVMLIERANCYLARDRFAEAYELASQVQDRGDEEFRILAMQYMAECCLGQRRVEEAMNLYREVQKRLPCRLVDEERIQTGIRNGMTYLERCHPQSKPF